jgi:hypothetical protein
LFSRDLTASVTVRYRPGEDLFRSPVFCVILRDSETRDPIGYRFHSSA